MWCIGTLNKEYRKRMYALIDLYLKPYDSNEPVICVDEKSTQLLRNTRKSIKGKIEKVDYEYERNGTQNIFLAVEPKAGKRIVRATKHRKKPDFAKFIHAVTELYPSAKIIHIVADNLNTHFESSFYETFPRKKVQRILSKIQFHYTPKHASWLNMAEIEIGIMQRQCLKRRIPDEQILKKELSAWQKQRNQSLSTIQWKFTKQDADQKLQRHYT